MSTIIEVNNLGKKYKIGEQEGGYTALRDVLTNIAKSPAEWFGRKAKAALEKEKSGEFWALKDVNFSVEKGEILGIIGRNGAGKSTLLKVLSQITPPTTGEVKLKGRVGSLLEVGTGFHPELTGRENIFLNGAILGMRKKEIEKKFDEIVDFAGVEKFLDLPVKRYSSGMYVRLAFAVAAHLEPDILIIDEVLAVGDMEFQKKCLGKMDEITRKEGRTVLLVSHNMEAIKNLSNRCILLDKGEKVFEGATNEALLKYRNTQSSHKLEISSEEYTTKRRSSGTLSFTDIKILDAGGRERNTFYADEKVRFNMSYKIYEEMVGLHVRIRFFSLQAKDLILTDIHYEIKSGKVKKDENGTVNIEVDIASLCPGEYGLYFWLGDSDAAKEGANLNYDTVDNLTDPLIVLEKNSSIRKAGIFSLPSKIVLH